MKSVKNRIDADLGELGLLFALAALGILALARLFH